MIGINRYFLIVIYMMVKKPEIFGFFYGIAAYRAVVNALAVMSRWQA